MLCTWILVTLSLEASAFASWIITRLSTTIRLALHRFFPQSPTEWSRRGWKMPIFPAPNVSRFDEIRPRCREWPQRAHQGEALEGWSPIWSVKNIEKWGFTYGNSWEFTGFWWFIGNFTNKNGNAGMPWENPRSTWNFIAGKIIELNCGCSSHVWWPHDRFVQSGNHPIAMVMRKITPLGSVLEAGPYKCTPRPLQAPRERMAEIYCVNWQRHKCKCLTNYRYSFAVSIDSIHINVIYTTIN